MFNRKHSQENRIGSTQPGAGRAQEGQSLIELALFLPTMLLVMVGVLDLGRAFHAYCLLHLPR
jgi:Flp pilus assembly protein TadG